MHAAPHALPKQNRRRRLARYEPIPAGDDCLTLVRAQELFRGKSWTAAEEQHLQACAWCWYFITHDEAECFRARPLSEMASGREPTDKEWEHLAKCPSCAYDYDLLRQDAAAQD